MDFDIKCVIVVFDETDNNMAIFDSREGFSTDEARICSYHGLPGEDRP
jgi:hypothetical protein